MNSKPFLSHTIWVSTFTIGVKYVMIAFAVFNHLKHKLKHSTLPVSIHLTIQMHCYFKP